MAKGRRVAKSTKAPLDRAAFEAECVKAAFAMEQLRNNLAGAAVLFRVEGRARDGARVALTAVIDTLQRFGSSHAEVAPLMAVFRELGDLDHGTVGPLLRANTPGKTPQPTTIWAAKALLAAAVEAQVSLGCSLDDAAARVARDSVEILPAVLDGGDQTRQGVRDYAARLINLRKQFKNRKAGPSSGGGDGEQLVAWDAAMAAIEASQGNPQRPSLLSAQYDKLIQLARQHAYRTP